MSSNKSLTKHSSRESKQDDTRSSSQRECEHVYQGIKRWKAHAGAVLLPVVRKSTVSILNERAKPRWWKMKKGMSRSLSPGPIIPILAMLNSSFYNSMLIDIDTGNSEGCYSRRPGSVEANKKLVLNGGSTFCGVRLDEWQTKRVGEHNVILGHDVVIQLSMGIPWTARDALAVISKQQREEVCRHFKEMCEAKCEGNPQWDKWREPVNKLLDVAAGTTSLAQVVECYAGGIVVEAATKLTASSIEGAFRVSAGLLCLSGPGQMALVGVGAAAAIYYIPWDTVWGWFRSAFGAFLSWLVAAWENLKSWVKSTVTTQGPALAKQAIEMRVHPILPA
ncbi:hypothetical protein VP1G_02122 [Cytospora mali]|uniref:Uncharacterized protein n=1 Tax=Cytospora mali TaxID=578113 RepID=A0A194USN1_CYTMA|nr:hypothetical protein VP1G_02122 [Valsa mali var. pyri (nom. inval.)]